MRRGLGIGRGKGYYNLVPLDSHIHSLSACGIKTQHLFSKMKVKQRTIMWNPKTNEILTGEVGHSALLRQSGKPTEQINSWVRAIYSPDNKKLYIRHYFNPQSPYAEFTAQDFAKSERMQERFRDKLQVPKDVEIEYNVTNSKLRQEGFIHY